MAEGKPGRLDDELANEMLRALAHLISIHVETHIQNTFLHRTGIARNRIFRLKRLRHSADANPGEIRFSFTELVRIARELGFSSLSELVARIERESLANLRSENPETTRRHKAIVLASIFLQLSTEEMDSIRQALEIVDGKPT